MRHVGARRAFATAASLLRVLVGVAAWRLAVVGRLGGAAA
jgi:hypothetical protein